MILDCDIGNTRCKWRLQDRGEVVRRGSCTHGETYSVLKALGAVDRIRVASVARQEVTDQFVEVVRSLAVTPEFAVTSSELAGVCCAYKDYSRLGVDRWLAVVAAFHHCQGAVLVLDAGSALTVDVVAVNGRHLGGYIVPGAVLMRSSLLSNTGQVRFGNDLHQCGLAFGMNTADAVNAGVWSALVGSILVAIAEAKRQVGEDFAILLTGGDAEALAVRLRVDFNIRVELRPDLVLDGLAFMLP